MNKKPTQAQLNSNLAQSVAMMSEQFTMKRVNQIPKSKSKLREGKCG